MTLITNRGKTNHRKLIVDLIKSSKEVIIFSGWMTEDGFKKLLPSFEEAIKNGAKITIFTNEKHTKLDPKTNLKAYGICHVLAKSKTLHSKIYYFQNNSLFTAVIGSANMTNGGLVSSEELSVKLEGKIDSPEHEEIYNYLKDLKKEYGECTKVR